MTFNGSFTYAPPAAIPVAAAGGTFGSCGINLCHNNGQSAQAVSLYTWNTALGSGTNSCTECHNALTNTLVSNSHGAHLTTSTGAGAVCNNCHAAATVNTHGDGSVTFNGTFTYTPPAAVPVAAAGGTFGTCGINLCHNNGQSAAADLGVHLEHGAGRRDEQLHGVPQRADEHAGEQLARGAPDELDGRRCDLRQLPRDSDGEHARGTDR